MKSTIDKTDYVLNPDRGNFRPGRDALTVSALFLFFGLLSIVMPGDVTAAPAKQEGPPPLVTVVKVTEQDVNPSTEYVGACGSDADGRSASPGWWFSREGQFQGGE